MAVKEAQLIKFQSLVGDLIVVKGIRRDYIGMREEACRLGLRPLTGRELDIALADDKTRAKLKEHAWWYRSVSIVAYRASDQGFDKIKIVDSYTDENGRKAVLLPEAIPKEAIGKTGAIFLEHPQINLNGNIMEITGLAAFVPNVIKNSGNMGILDEKTSLVVQGNGKEGKIRRYYKTYGEDRVVPIGRDSNYDFWRNIDVANKPQILSGIVLVDYDSNALQTIQSGNKFKQLYRV